MKFRLTYYGALRPTNRDAIGPSDPLTGHKQAIREVFHGQLKELWQTNKFLREHRVGTSFGAHFRPIAEESGATWGGGPVLPLMREVMANWCPGQNGFRFLPLAATSFDLQVSLNILFLRRDPPGSAFNAGDIDNRIKTLIDALRPPKVPNEYVGKDMQPITPKDDQDPFYVLMEDDNQISHFAVETDTLLDPRTADDADVRAAKVIITVELRPNEVNTFNVSFA